MSPRATRQREVIGQIIASAEGPLSVPDLHTRAQHPLRMYRLPCRAHMHCSCHDSRTPTLGAVTPRRRTLQSCGHNVRGCRFQPILV